MVVLFTFLDIFPSTIYLYWQCKTDKTTSYKKNITSSSNKINRISNIFLLQIKGQDYEVSQ